MTYESKTPKWVMLDEILKGVGHRSRYKSYRVAEHKIKVVGDDLSGLLTVTIELSMEDKPTIRRSCACYWDSVDETSDMLCGSIIAELTRIGINRILSKEDGK